MLPPAPLQKAAFARWLGCAPSRITEWIARGSLTAPAVLPSGLIVADIAVDQLIAARILVSRHEPTSVSTTAQPPAAGNRGADPASGAAPSYDSARATHESLKVRLTELKLLERRSELVPRALADAVLFDAARALRDAWQAWPARVAAVMAARLGVPPAASWRSWRPASATQLAAVADPAADWRLQSAARHTEAAMTTHAACCGRRHHSGRPDDPIRATT